MKKIYVIRKFSSEEIAGEDFWEKIEPAKLSERPWKEYEYHPETQARLVMSEKGFHLLMTSCESFLRAEMTENNSPVCTDSCMEFFFAPRPEKSMDYINLEVNPRGVYFCATGGGRHDRVFTDENLNRALNIRTWTESGSLDSVSEPQRWYVRADLPVDYLDTLFGRGDYSSGRVLRGNFYKCGDLTVHPHYCCWSGIGLPSPDYHCPDWFGELVIE